MGLKIFDKEKKGIIIDWFAKGFDFLIFLHSISNVSIFQITYY